MKLPQIVALATIAFALGGCSTDSPIIAPQVTQDGDTDQAVARQSNADATRDVYNLIDSPASITGSGGHGGDQGGGGGQPGNGEAGSQPGTGPSQNVPGQSLMINPYAH